jgi:hypothetical protein
VGGSLLLCCFLSFVRDNNYPYCRSLSSRSCKEFPLQNIKQSNKLNPKQQLSIIKQWSIFRHPCLYKREYFQHLRLRSLSSTTLHSSITRLSDGIFRVHRFSVVTSTRLHKSIFIFRFYVYSGTFNNPAGYFFYLHVEQFLAHYALMGFLDLLRLLVCFLPLFLTLTTV